MIEGRGGHTVPLEVMSGRKVHSHAALNKLLENRALKIPEDVVLSSENVHVNGKVTYLPLYMTFYLDELTVKESEAEGFTFAPVAV